MLLGVLVSDVGVSLLHAASCCRIESNLNTIQEWSFSSADSVAL